MTTPEVPGFDQVMFTHQGRSHPVYRAGTGPAVIVIHEIPGIHPGMLTFAQRLIAAGYTVYLPSLFGRPGEPFGAGPLLRSVLRVCVSREFAILAGQTHPDRDLAAGPGGQGLQRLRRSRGGRDRDVSDRRVRAGHGGGAGGAGVGGQPAGLPAPVTARKRAAVGLDAADLAQVKARTRGGLCVLGLWFSADRGCPAERFQMLRRELGEGFEAIEVDSSPGNPYGIPTRAHAVLTVDLVDAPGHPHPGRPRPRPGFLDQRLHQ